MLCIRGICFRRVSVRLSVTSRCSTKTAKRRITHTTPYDSSGSLVSDAKDLCEIRPGSLPAGAPNAGGVGQNRRLSTNSWLYSTRSSAIAEGPRDASCQLKSCQLPRNSAETTCTTSPEQIDGMKLEV